MSVPMPLPRSDADIRADLDQVSITERAGWTRSGEADEQAAARRLAGDVGQLLARAEQAEAWIRHLTGETERWVQAVSEMEAELAWAETRLAKVRALLAHAKNVSPSQSMTVYVTDLEAALEGRT